MAESQAGMYFAIDPRWCESELYEAIVSSTWDHAIQSAYPRNGQRPTQFHSL